jgi:fructose-1,6-bisphosphatase class II
VTKDSIKHIGLEMVRVTEAAAVSASKWVGSGDKLSVDKAATDAMKSRLDALDVRAEIKIGEGKKDNSFGLFQGDQVGNGNVSFDIAVDPVEGTTPTSEGGPEAMSVMAFSEKDTMFTTEAHYMLKLACGPQLADAGLSLKHNFEENLRIAAKALNKPLNQLTVCILKRPRHEAFIQQARYMGVRLKLIQDCDVSGAVATCLPDSGIDIQYGAGGAPEAVITAAAVKCMGGVFQAQLWEGDTKIYESEDLVAGPCCFVATGITNGSMLKGVRWADRPLQRRRVPITHSVFMRSTSGTVRFIESWHGN